MEDSWAGEVRGPEAAPRPKSAPGSDGSDSLLVLQARVERGELSGIRRVALDNGLVVINVELAARRLIEGLAEARDGVPARLGTYSRRQYRQFADLLGRLERALASRPPEAQPER